MSASRTGGGDRVGRPAFVALRQLRLASLIAVLAAGALLIPQTAAAALPPTVPMLWAAPYVVADPGSSFCEALAQAPAGDAYVLSSLTTPASLSTVVLARLTAATGAAAWTRTTTGRAGLGAYPRDVAGAGGRGVAITGASSAGALDADVLTAMYDTDGGLRWSKELDGGRHGYDQGAAVAVDRAGNVLVAGSVQRRSSFMDSDFAVLKYSPRGRLLWKYVYSTRRSDSATDILVDAGGNAYVVGTVDSAKGGPSSLLTLSLSPAGKLRWSSRIGAPGVTYNAGTLLSRSGSVYACASVRVLWSAAMPVVVKYSSTGRQAWAAGAGRAWYMGFGATLDADGRVCWCGVDELDTGGGTISIGAVAVLKPKGTSGLQAYSTFWGEIGPVDYAVSLEDIVVDDLGRVYCCGWLALDGAGTANAPVVLRWPAPTSGSWSAAAIWSQVVPWGFGNSFSRLLHVGDRIYAGGTAQAGGHQVSFVQSLSAVAP